MRVNIDRNILSEFISMGSEISDKEPGTIFHEIKLMATGDVMYVASVNSIGSQFFTGKIDGEGCEIIEEGTVCIPGRPFKDALSLLTSETISLVSDGCSTQISTDGNEDLALCGCDPENWPPIPKMSTKAASFKIQSSILKEIHSLMSFSCSKDQTKAPVTSILIEITTDGTIHCTSTDQQRVSFYHGPSGTASDIEMGRFDQAIKIAMPTDVISCLTNKMLSHVDQTINISVDASKILFSTPTMRYCCSQETGAEKYPRMRDLLQAKHSFSFSVPRSEFIRISKIVKIVATKSVCKVSFDVGESLITLSGKGKINKSNRSKQSISVLDFDGDLMDVYETTVSSEDLNEAISSVKTDDVKIGLTITNNDTVGPILTIEQDDVWKHLVFPAREVE